MQANIDDSAVGTKPSKMQPVRLFHGFLEAAPDAVVIIDGDGVIVQINSQTEKLFGHRREELLGAQDRSVEICLGFLPSRLVGTTA